MESEFVNSNASTKNEPRRDPNSLNAQPWLDEHMIKVDTVLHSVMHALALQPFYLRRAL
jgi:hypothetical protein